jgi:GxxExxY protein
MPLTTSLARLRTLGLEVHTQVIVRAEHGSFQKRYFLDLVVNQMLYELKVVALLVQQHDAQALHYAIMQDIRLVKLLNFGGPRVRGKLLQNALQGKDRTRPSLRKSGMKLLTPNCDRLVAHMRELLHDWGTHLSPGLYSEALVHHFGGETHCVNREELTDGPIFLGTHPVQLHSERHAFTVTALHRDHAATAGTSMSC